ncbi:MAG: Rieske (2Fe-2S) protein [bacterium]
MATPVLPIAELPPGTIRKVMVGDTPVLLHNVGGTIYATSDTCCHMGADLEQAELINHVLICPWHGWQYDVTNGQCLINAGAKLLTYPVTVENDQIAVDAG